MSGKMATPSKRPKTGQRAANKKSTPQKRRGKQRHSKNKKNRRTALWLRRGVVSLIFLGFFAVVGYSYLRNTDEVQRGAVVDQEVIYPYSQEEILRDLANVRTKKTPQRKQAAIHHKNKPARHTHREDKSTSPEHPVERHAASHSADDRERSMTSGLQKIVLAYRTTRPKLVIIIDDVHTRAQIDAIRSLSWHVTPSVFPPYSLAKHSNELAKGLKHYMIHLPMESGSTQFNRQTKTLMRSFSDAQIEARAKELRRLFPTAVYVNNHTGSTFTSDYRAMKRLYDALKKEGFVFVDSFTIASSKVKRIAHEEGDAYVRRDIFIDNKQDIAYIHRQLAKAVSIARKKGYAIAIGHPHKKTIAALRSAKPILKDVDVVYIDEIYRRQ
jgi:polysaccharide deacetylase 2 family uncharacterized protein YibQ